MAAPVYTSDLTDIVVPPMNTGDWGAFGGGASGLNVETDYFLIDSDCLSKNAWSGDYKGMMYDNVTDITFGTLEALWMWLTHLTPNSLATEAAGGLRINMADDNTEGTFDSWYVGGSDTIVYDDRWICAVADPGVAPDLDQSATSTYSWFGAGANLPVGGPTKGSPFAINAIRYGRIYTVTEGDLANGYATFDGAATFDNDSTRRLGHIIFSKGVYTMQGIVALGSASAAVDFRDSNRTIFIADTRKVRDEFNGLQIDNVASNVEWTNISIQALGTTSPGRLRMLHAGSTFTPTSCSFVDLGRTFLQPGATLDGCTFLNCGDVYQGGATITNCTFNGTTLIVDDPSLVSGCSFRLGSGAGHGVELRTPGTYEFADNTFSGFGATGTATAGVGNLSGGKTVLNVTGSGNVPTIFDQTGSSMGPLQASEIWASPGSSLDWTGQSILDDTGYFLVVIEDQGSTGSPSVTPTTTGMTWTEVETRQSSFQNTRHINVFRGVNTSGDKLSATISIAFGETPTNVEAFLYPAGSGSIATSVVRGDTDWDDGTETIGSALPSAPTVSEWVVHFGFGSTLARDVDITGQVTPERAQGETFATQAAIRQIVTNQAVLVDGSLSDWFIVHKDAETTDTRHEIVNESGVNDLRIRRIAAIVPTGSSTTEAIATKTVKVTAVDDTGTAIQGARCLVRAAGGGDLPSEASVTITRSGSTASVSHTAHGMSDGQQVEISGADQQEYNGIVSITNVTTNAYDYTVSGTPTTPATGTITSTAVILNGTTDVNGEIEDSGFEFTNAQPIAGRLRRGTSQPYYRTAPFTGTITTNGFDATITMVADE